jgi:8-oxo-dGTP diphosphatase
MAFEEMKNKQETPKVGVGVLVFNSKGELLLMKRQGSYGEGKWSLPGGHFDIGETLLECCARELKEETNLDILSIKKFTFANNIMEDEGLHYVTLFVTAISWKGKVENMEPEKCSRLGWFNPHDLPEPLFVALQKVMVEFAEVNNDRWV